MRHWSIVLLGALLGLGTTEIASAQDYPNRTITVVVPFAPGGLSDIPARILAAELQQRVGQAVVVDNRPGASGITGGSFVARAEPDGYTLIANALADVQNLHYLPVPYSAVDDFAMIGMVADGPPLILITNPSLPYRSVADVIADAKARPNTVSFGSSGPATSPAIAISQLNSIAKTTIVDVPYRGTGPAATGVMTGEIQGAFVFYSNARPLADDGKVRALGVTSPQRLASWPEVPTIAEQGFPGFDHRGFVGLAAPRGTPAAVIAFLNRQLNDIIHSASFQARLAPLGMTVPMGDNSPKAFADFMRRETTRQAELAKLSGHSVGEQKR